MLGSEFLQTYAKKPYTSWEAAVIELARSGSIVGWPLIPLRMTDAAGHFAEVMVASDYLAVGSPEDHVRIPLTPIPAQRVADLFGFFLPTPKIATEIWRQAKQRLTPTPMVPNQGANLAQYAAHNAAIDEQTRGQPLDLLSNGQKKDVVIGKLVKPGKVIIFGWFWPDDPTVHGPFMTDNLRASNPIQPYSDAHGDFYVDYSHGIRLVSGDVITDRGPMRYDAALADPTYGPILSSEGPLGPTSSRYPAPLLSAGIVVPYRYNATPTKSLADKGLDAIRVPLAERKAS